jgi:hypothetical protein
MNSSWPRDQWEDLPEEFYVEGALLDPILIEKSAIQSPYWNSWNLLSIEPEQRPSTEKRRTFCTQHLAKNEVLQRSKESEENFGLSVRSKTLEWFEASDIEDMRHHTDCFIRSCGKVIPSGLYPIDVKAYKPISSGRALQTQFLWLEVHAKGSVFSGLSTSIAAQYTPNKFVLLHKKALQSYIQSRLTNTRPVVRNKQALYRLYKREEKRDEWLTLVDFLDCVRHCAVYLF